MDTGYESTRVKIFETFPRSGLPPAFPDYQAFENYVDLMVAAGAMDDYTFCWWDVRPHSRFGTIELRVLDSQTSLVSAIALTALTQCLVVKALSEPPKGPYPFDLAIENKWRASRHGLDAVFYDAERGTSVSAKEMARTLVDELRPVSQDLKCENELLDVLEIVENGTGSQQQRRVYEESGDFLDVVAFLIEGTRPEMVAEASSESRAEEQD
jgi:carboxylate-amine ligase